MSKRAEEIALEAYPPEMRKAFELLPKDWNKPLRTACVKGYEQAEKDLGWISVKDRLPEKDGWYFTCVEISGIPQCVGLSHFETYSGQWDDDDDSIELVDYWMPIPKLPNQEEK
jgi:hypothetical protein